MRWLPLLTLVGCVHLKSVSVTPVPAERGTPVSASAETPLLFLGIGFKDTFADDLADDLRKQCEGGTVTGILTKYEQLSYPLLVRYNVVAKGWCVR